VPIDAKAQNRIWELLKSESPPSFLEHYTSVEALVSISQSQVLWASDCRFLNDSSELVVGLDLIHTEVLERLKGESAESELAAEVLDNVRLGKAKHWQKGDSISFVPVLCLTAAEDDLSQWRGYSKGSRGVALSLNPVLLEGINYNHHLARVRYGKEDWHPLIDAAAETLVALCRNRVIQRSWEPADLNLWEEQVHLYGYRACVTAAALMKDQAFSAEKEWRLIHSVPSAELPGELHFRVARGLIVPFREVKLRGIPSSRLLRKDPSPAAESAVTGLRVGPTPHPDLAMLSARALAQTAFPPVSPTLSKVPYRDW
jgi:hypothetical protein